MVRKIRGLASVSNLWNNGTQRITVIDGPGYVILEVGNSVQSAGLTAEQARILGDQLYTAAEILEKREKQLWQNTAPCETSKKQPPASVSSNAGATDAKVTGSRGG